MDDFPGNSRTNQPQKPSIIGGIPTNNPQPDEPKLESVVTGRVIIRKKSLGRRMKETLFSSDSNGIIGYLWREVLVPALQDTATSMVQQGIEKAVYGEVR